MNKHDDLHIQAHGNGAYLITRFAVQINSNLVDQHFISILCEDL